MPTQERLRELLDYDPETGVFTWKVGRRTGKTAGGVDKEDGYISLNVLGKTYTAHRLAWLHTYGNWPSILDHCNGCRTDNRVSNLREVTSRQNCQNLKSHREGRLLGATSNGSRKRTKTWRARIVLNGVKHCLGSFNTEQEAHEAYCEAHFQLFGTYPLKA